MHYELPKPEMIAVGTEFRSNFSLKIRLIRELSREYFSKLIKKIENYLQNRKKHINFAVANGKDSFSE